MSPTPPRPAAPGRTVVNGSFRGQRITGQQRYATEIADRLLSMPGVRESSLADLGAGSALRAWWGAQSIGRRRAGDERLLTLTSRGPVVARRHVVVVHDLFVLEHPEWFSRRYVLTHAPVLRAQLRTAELVVAVSEPVAARLSGLIRPGTPVITVPNAAAEIFQPGLPDPESLAAHGLRRNGYILAVGNLDPRKNLARLAAAHAALPEELRTAYPLVLVGEAKAIFAGGGVADAGATRLGYVDDPELARLYAAAAVVAFPALDEGFGLPAVEALSAGADVLVSDVPALRWVCGDHGRYVDPLSVESIRDGLIEALASPTPAAQRADRAIAMRERFSWDTSAARLHAAVRDLGGVAEPATPVAATTEGARPLRVAQFTSSLIEPLGGAEQYCLAVARQQKLDGHEVTVLTGWVDHSVRASLAEAGIPVQVLPTRRPYTPDGHGSSPWARASFHGRDLLDSLRRTPATRAIQRGGFDVVHVHRFSGFGTGVLSIGNQRTLHTVHDYSLVHTSASLVAGDELLERPGLLQSWRRRLLTRRLGTGLTVVFPSRRTRDNHTAWGFRPRRARSVVVPHGWPATGPGDGAVVPEDAAVDPRVAFLFLGKLSEHKGVPTLLEAWGTGIRGAVLRVAGSGPLAARVTELAAGSGADGPPGIEVLGWLDQGARTRELARADALVLPSQWPENFPIVVAESLLLGRPVITTEVASPPLVDDGESGLLVDHRPEDLRAALVRFASDAGLRARLSAGAAARAGELDMRTHLTRLEQLYADDPAPGRATPAVHG